MKYTLQWLIEQYENGVLLKYLFFWGHTDRENKEVGKSVLSQWYESPFTVNKVTYKTAEHWMMAQKALLFGDKNNYDKIIDAESPKEAKKLGQEVINFDSEIWDKHKFEIVRAGSIHKFIQNKEMGEYLLCTGQSIIAEASPVDAIWGTGMAQDHKDIYNLYLWRGQNLLGFALMEARDFINEYGFIKPLNKSIEAPWNTFPNEHPTDMFWRMGIGEDYLTRFSKYYNSLSERDKVIYKLYNPVTACWSDFL